jgi:hypothetical protein
MRRETSIEVTSVGICGVIYKYVGTTASGTPYSKTYKDSRGNCLSEDEFAYLILKGEIILDKQANHVSRMKAYGHATSK